MIWSRGSYYVFSQPPCRLPGNYRFSSVRPKIFANPYTPQIAAEVASPMSKIDEIVMVSGNDGSMSSEVTKLLAQLPPSVQALTGLDITKVSSLLAIRVGFMSIFNE